MTAGSPPPTLGEFFDAVGPYLRGQASLDAVRAKLGPVDPDLAFYAWLVRFDQRRILSELYADCRTWIERRGLDWAELCDAYVREHPPSGTCVVQAGEAFPDWLARRRLQDDRLPVGIEALADWTYTRLVARNAPDLAELRVDERVHVRRYPLDPVSARRALREGREPTAGSPVTLVIFRSRDRVRAMPATLATVAVLVAASQPGAHLPPPLDRVPGPELRDEHRRLVGLGLLPAEVPPC